MDICKDQEIKDKWELVSIGVVPDIQDDDPYKANRSFFYFPTVIEYPGKVPTPVFCNQGLMETRRR